MPTTTPADSQTDTLDDATHPFLLSQRALEELIIDEWGVSGDNASIIYSLLNRVARYTPGESYRVPGHLVEWVGEELCHTLYDDGYDPSAPSLLFYLNYHFSYMRERTIWLSVTFDEATWPRFGSLVLHNVRQVDPR